MLIDIPDDMLANYSKIASSIDNSEVDGILCDVINKQTLLLKGIKEVLSTEQYVYVDLFNRFAGIFKAAIQLSNADNGLTNIASINILTRAAVEVSLIQAYLLHTGYIKEANGEDERKFKLHNYCLKGYISKRNEFKEMEGNGLESNSQLIPVLEREISEFKSKIQKNPAYALLNKEIRGEIGRRFFLTRTQIFSYKDMIASLSPNTFFVTQYTFLSSYTHCGYESFRFKKDVDGKKDERLLILYIACTLMFFTIRGYFKIDFNSFTEREGALILDFMHLINRGTNSDK